MMLLRDDEQCREDESRTSFPQYLSLTMFSYTLGVSPTDTVRGRGRYDKCKSITQKRIHPSGRVRFSN
jgi:hypothetical protein